MILIFYVVVYSLGALIVGTVLALYVLSVVAIFILTALAMAVRAIFSNRQRKSRRVPTSQAVISDRR